MRRFPFTRSRAKAQETERRACRGRAHAAQRATFGMRHAGEEVARCDSSRDPVPPGYSPSTHGGKRDGERDSGGRRKRRRPSDGDRDEGSSRDEGKREAKRPREEGSSRDKRRDDSSSAREEKRPRDEGSSRDKRLRDDKRLSACDEGSRGSRTSRDVKRGGRDEGSGREFGREYGGR
eukprot:4025870-Prymnesium_polylepis.1